MRETGILFRFIDLGLVLLMAFLAVADIQSETQVGLPGGLGEADQRVLYRLRFDAAMRASLERWPEGATRCTGQGTDALTACLQAAGGAATVPRPLFILSPQRGAVVEQLVFLLDLCRAEGWACAPEA